MKGFKRKFADLTKHDPEQDEIGLTVEGPESVTPLKVELSGPQKVGKVYQRFEYSFIKSKFVGKKIMNSTFNFFVLLVNRFSGVH